MCSSNCNICLWCKRLLYSSQKKRARINSGQNILTVFSPNKQKSYSRIQKAKEIIQKQNFRRNSKILKLQNSLNKIQNEMKNLSEQKLSDILNKANVSQGQSELIKEIFAAAKFKNPKSRRYNENWMLLCLMFQIR